MSYRPFPPRVEAFRNRLRNEGRCLARTLEARTVWLPLCKNTLEKDTKDKEWRSANCKVIADGMTLGCDRKHWTAFLDLAGIPKKDRIVARLRSRLLIGVSSGVFENGGISMDRITGRPCIPGSAVKGCARRWALLKLVECGSVDEKCALLLRIALVFGWIEDDWRTGRNPKTDELYSDFEWACSEEDWTEVKGQVLAELKTAAHGIEPDEDGRLVMRSASKGAVNFLPAHAALDPRHCDIQSDIVTNHHPAFTAAPETGAPGVWSGFLPEIKSDVLETLQNRPVPDVEEPNPVVFPAVAPNVFFVFAILGGSETEREDARRWLAESLDGIGVGARTGVGYGWFDCSPENFERLESDTKKDRRDESGEDEVVEPELDAADAARKEVAALNEEQFKVWLQRFPKKKKGLTEHQKVALVEALASPERSDIAQWLSLSLKPVWKPVRDAIREFAMQKGIECSL